MASYLIYIYKVNRVIYFCSQASLTSFLTLLRCIIPYCSYYATDYVCMESSNLLYCMRSRLRVFWFRDWKSNGVLRKPCATNPREGLSVRTSQHFQNNDLYSSCGRHGIFTLIDHWIPSRNCFGCLHRNSSKVTMLNHIYIKF